MCGYGWLKFQLDVCIKATILKHNENVEKAIFLWLFNLSLKRATTPNLLAPTNEPKNHNHFSGLSKTFANPNWHDILSELLLLLINSENELRVRISFRNNFVVSYLMNFSPIIIVVMQMFVVYYVTKMRIWFENLPLVGRIFKSFVLCKMRWIKSFKTNS